MSLIRLKIVSKWDGFDPNLFSLHRFSHRILSFMASIIGRTNQFKVGYAKHKRMPYKRYTVEYLRATTEGDSDSRKTITPTRPSSRKPVDTSRRTRSSKATQQTKQSPCKRRLRKKTNIIPSNAASILNLNDIQFAECVTLNRLECDLSVLRLEAKKTSTTSAGPSTSTRNKRQVSGKRTISYRETGSNSKVLRHTIKLGKRIPEPQVTNESAEKVTSLPVKKTYITRSVIQKQPVAKNTVRTKHEKKNQNTKNVTKRGRSKLEPRSYFYKPRRVKRSLVGDFIPFRLNDKVHFTKYDSVKMEEARQAILGLRHSWTPIIANIVDMTMLASSDKRSTGKLRLHAGQSIRLNLKTYNIGIRLMSGFVKVQVEETTKTMDRLEEVRLPTGTEVTLSNQDRYDDAIFYYHADSLTELLQRSIS